jgi:hypothetical protein
MARRTLLSHVLRWRSRLKGLDARSSSGERRLSRLGGHEPGVGSSATADPNLVAGGGALEVVAEVVAELVAADVDG